MGPRPVGQTLILRPGDYLFKGGQSLRAVFIIEEGSLRATVVDPRDVQPGMIVEETFGLHSVFGWDYMLWQDGDPPLLAPFSLVVPDNVPACRVRSFSREEFLEHLTRHPEGAYSYLATTLRAISRLLDPTRMAGALSQSGEVPPPRSSQPGGTVAVLQKTVNRLERTRQLNDHVLLSVVMPLLEPHKKDPGVDRAIEMLRMMITGQAIDGPPSGDERTPRTSEVRSVAASEAPTNGASEGASGQRG